MCLTLAWLNIFRMHTCNPTLFIPMPKITSQPYPVRPVLVRTDVPSPALPRIPTARVTSATQAIRATVRAGYQVPKVRPWPPSLSNGEWLVPVIPAR